MQAHAFRVLLRLKPMAVQHLLALALQHQQFAPAATQPGLEPRLLAIGRLLQLLGILAQTQLQVSMRA